MLSGMEASGTQFGEWWVPNKHYMYATQVLTQELYPRIIQTIRDLAGGALIMLPSSVMDFSNPVIEAIIKKTQRSTAMDAEHKVKFLKATWDAIGSEFGSRHTQYEMFYSGARFVTAGHSLRTFDWNHATGLVEGLRLLRFAGRAQARTKLMLNRDLEEQKKDGPAERPQAVAK
jgi:4-hydroxyphenylacetate 3-monooxygenase